MWKFFPIVEFRCRRIGWTLEGFGVTIAVQFNNACFRHMSPVRLGGGGFAWGHWNRFSLPCSVRHQARVLSIRTGVRNLCSLRQASSEWKSDGCRENTHLVRIKAHRASVWTSRAGIFLSRNWELRTWHGGKGCL